MGGFDVISAAGALREKTGQLRWSGTFSDYLEIVRESPKVASLAHARLFHMIASAGVDEDSDGRRHYKFFDNELFGLEKPIRQLVEEYLSPASRRLDVRKRILMLVGPVGGGKSTLATLLKKGLERHSLTDDGAVYAILGCPMHEEPLHLVPDELRAAFRDEFGVSIEGDLCPSCRFRLETEWNGRIGAAPVERVILSERDRKGIGTFKPADPKSQDVAELTGSVNLSVLAELGSEADPRAYNFDGELNIANRGVIEFIEMLKAEKRFLYELNTVAGEQTIKASRFALIYADLCVLAHTNEYEYNAYFGNKENEAMIDRIFVVRVPYNLRLTEEIRIYDKLIRQSTLTDERIDLSGVHIAPNTLRVAAMFAILSRLKTSKKSGMSLMAKLKLYDGERQVGEWDHKQVGALQDEFSDEGMNGLSPRFVMNRLSAALVRGDKSCITPIDVLRAMRDGLKDTVNSDEEYRRLLGLLDETRRDYDEIAKKEVQRAFVYSYEQSTKTLLDNYLDNVDAFSNRAKVKDPITGDEIEPDERLMRSIEEQIGVSDNARREFREGIMRSVASVSRRGGSFGVGSDERLREALEKKLFSDLKDIVKITTSTRTPDSDQLKKINEVIERLCAEGGYTPASANELLRYVGTLLNR